MKKRIAAGIGIVVLLFLILFIVFQGSTSSNQSIEVAEDEIRLQIKLDVEEDIGLFIIDYEVNGLDGSGGISNANKSLLKHDELLTYTISKQELNDVDALNDMSFQFTIITEYIDPNYENIYPKELTKQMESIRLDAKYGKTYRFTVTGDAKDGYKAVLEE